MTFHIDASQPLQWLLVLDEAAFGLIPVTPCLTSWRCQEFGCVAFSQSGLPVPALAHAIAGRHLVAWMLDKFARLHGIAAQPTKNRLSGSVAAEDLLRHLLQGHQDLNYWVSKLRAALPQTVDPAEELTAAALCGMDEDNLHTDFVDAKLKYLGPPSIKQFVVTL